MTTIAQKYRNEGIQIGKEKGKLEGIQLGQEKGKIEGKKEGKLEIAKSMLMKGYPIEDIILLTGLSPAAIKELA